MSPSITDLLAVNQPRAQFRGHAWLEFQRALDPLGEPKRLKRLAPSFRIGFHPKVPMLLRKEPTSHPTADSSSR